MMDSLRKVLDMAYDQAINGKGKERHGNGKPFEEQPWRDICSLTSEDFMLGQAMKKLNESRRLPHEAAVKEQLGAIVFTAMCVITRMEKMNNVIDGDCTQSNSSDPGRGTTGV